MPFDAFHFCRGVNQHTHTDTHILVQDLYKTLHFSNYLFLILKYAYANIHIIIIMNWTEKRKQKGKECREEYQAESGNDTLFAYGTTKQTTKLAKNKNR